MADKLPDASERAERYGIDRRVWRVAMLILFTVLAVTGCLMSIALGAADISVSQVAEILLSDYLEYTAAQNHCGRHGRSEPVAFRRHFTGCHA